MGGLIVDTSAWIHYSREASHPLSILIRDKLIQQPDQLFTCPPIVQEFLQGIRNEEDFEDAVQMFLDISVLSEDAFMCSVGAAKLFRSLRKKGVTIRKPHDCLIAWYAIRFDLTLVHDDRDFDLIALNTPLKVLSTR